MKEMTTKALFILIILAALFGLISSPVALLLGFGFTTLLHNPFQAYSHKAIHQFLKIAVVGLGFGVFIKETLETSRQGFSLTFLSIVFTVGLGLVLTRFFKLDKKLGHLITSGTSIFGGSAIAAVSPVIKAKSKTISSLCFRWHILCFK